MVALARKIDQAIIEQYRSALVLGAGETGYSVIRYLFARGLQIRVMDTRLAPPMAKRIAKNFPQVECRFGTFDEGILQDSALIVLSPGINLHQPDLQAARQAGSHITGDVELFVQENTKPIIAITGSNGKSTVTTLAGKMCQAGGLKTLIAGNIGSPVLNALTDKVSYDVAVIELSSFQLETTGRLGARAAAILNISADHMDRYDSIGSYVLAKTAILRGAKQVVLPLYDEMLNQVMSTDNVLSFALDEPNNDSQFGVSRIVNRQWLVKGNQRLIKRDDIPLTGLHNVKNVLAAFALVDFLQLPLASKVAAVREFTGLPHRMETIAVHDGITWINDSKATNIGATLSALSSLNKKEVIWIAGGQGKGADFTEMSKAIGSNIKMLVVLGKDAQLIEKALQGKLEIKHVANMSEAVKCAGQHAGENSIVLLSPACASFDMYRNYAYRGVDFTNLVRAWIRKGAA